MGHDKLQRCARKEQVRVLDRKAATTFVIKGDGILFKVSSVWTTT